MDIEDLRTFALSFAGAEEDLPFGPDCWVCKVGGKVFMLLPLDRHPISFNVKQDPEKSLRLREDYPQVTPGWHMNKKHWNTVVCSGLPPKLIKECITDSYRLVFNSLPAGKRKVINPEK